MPALVLHFSLILTLFYSFCQSFIRLRLAKPCQHRYRIAIILDLFAFAFVQMRLFIKTPLCVVIILHIGVFCLLFIFTGSV